MKGLNIIRLLFYFGVLVFVLLYFIMSFGLGDSEHQEPVGEEIINFFVPVMVIVAFIVIFRIFNFIVHRRSKNENQK